MIYSNPNGSSGFGELVITLAGRPPVSSRASSFEGISHRNGRVTTGFVTLKTDLIYEDLFGSGVDLILEKGGQFLVSGSTQFAGGIRMRLPYFRTSGERAEIQLAQTIHNASGSSRVVPASFVLESNGGFSISQQSARLIKPAINTDSDGLKIAGIRISTNGMAINFTHPGTGGKPFDFRATTGAELNTYVPNLLTQGDAPLGLRTDNLVLNEDGIVSFDAKIHFANVFLFAQPMDFAMNVKSAAVSYSKDRFTTFSIEGDLILPTSVQGDVILSSNVPGSIWRYQRAVLRGVKMNLNQQKWAVTPGTQGSTISFGDRDNPKTLYKLAIQSYSIDLSREGGIRVESGELSGGIFGSNQSKCLGQDSPKGVQVKNLELFIDTFGVSGAVSLPTSFCVKPLVGNFAVTAFADANSKLEFKQNAQVGGESNLSGTVQLGEMGALFVRVQLREDATTVITLDEGKDLPTLHLKTFKVGVALSAVSLQETDSGYNLSLDGALAFNTAVFGLKPIDVALPFNNLGLNATQGFIAASPDGMISLNNPAGLDLGLFSLDVTQFRFPFNKDNDIKLIGGVRLSGDLALSGHLDYTTGLTINSRGTLNFGEITFTDLGLMDVATISGSLKAMDQTVRDGATGALVTRPYLYGDITKFKLKFPETDMGGGLHFLVGHGTWLVFGNVVIPPQLGPIPLGGTGFSLYGFRGGLGHNVKLNQPIGPNFNPTELSSKDFSPTQDGSWLFQAGVRVGTNDAFLLWGDATLTVATQPLLVNLNLVASLLQPMSAGPSLDRTALGNMTYDHKRESFRTTMQVDLAFPSRELQLAHATGSADVLFSPTDQHVWIGWPPPSAPVAVSVLGRGGQQGGLAFGDLDPPFPGRKGVGATFAWSADFGFINGEIDGTLIADLTDIKEGRLAVVGVLHASGSVHFLIFDASVEAMLQAQLQNAPFRLDLIGELRGCVGIKFIGHVCESIGPATFSIKK